MNDVIKTILNRRSIRAFTDEKIDRDCLYEIARAGIHAPSGRNRQSWNFAIIDNIEKIHELESAVRIQLELGETYSFYNPAAIILVSNKRDNTNGLADSACAMENIFLAAYSMGIGSVWINQLKLICDETPIRTLLSSYHVPSNHIVYGIAALGYAKEDVGPKRRKENVINFVD